MVASINLISVIVPVYNAESTLIRCVESILAQTYKNFELILVDDGSQDRSAEIIDKYASEDSHVTAIHKTNGGVSSARNVALEVAKGDWIAFCDSDDYVDIDWLDNFICINSGVDLVIQGIIYEHVDSSTFHVLENKYGQTLESKKDLISTLMAKGMFGYPVTKLFKRSIIENNNIRFNTNSHFREDEEFFSKYLLYVKSWRSSNKAGYHYFMPDGTKTYKGNSYQSIVSIFQSLDTIFDQKYPTAIANIHVDNIKDLITRKCHNGEIPTKYECNLFRRLLKEQSTAHGNCFVNYLIISSHKSALSRLVIRLLHSLISIVKSLNE